MEDETPNFRAEQIAARALSRAEHQPVGRLRTLAQRLEAGTRAMVAERIAACAVLSQRPVGYALRRAGAVVAAAVTIAAGTVGVGAIANQASPGDILYGVDRGLETVGSVFGTRSNHAQERLSEALRLIDQGRSTEAVALVDEAVKDYTAQHGLTDLEREYAETRVSQLTTGTTSTTEPGPATTASQSSTPTTAVQTTDDPVTALRLAVEMLLRDVRQTDTPSDAVAKSALQAAAAATAVEDQGPVIAAASTTTTTEGTTVESSTTTAPNTITLPTDTTTTGPLDSATTTTTTGGTTITLPGDTPTTTAPGETTTTAPGETTTTTVPGETTTTTAPGGTTSTTTTTAPGGGGIILPPQP